jgi:hypothetical protein
MKNLLSENMLRFGTKNLSESAQKELIVKSIMQTINEHGLQSAVRRSLLTEQTDVDLMTHTGAKVALKSLKALLAAGTKLPCSVVMGPYSLVVQSNALTDGGQVVARGVVGGLHSQKIDGCLVPIPSNLGLSEGGKLEFINAPADAPKNAFVNTGFTILNFVHNRLPAAGTSAEIAAAINKAFMYYTFADVHAMLAAHEKNAVFVAGIAAFKASTTSKIKPLLTGGAKSFYLS